MKLKELYDARPPSRHGEIKVLGDRIVVTDANATEEYVVGPEGELELVHSDRWLRQAIATIRAKVGA